jgi:hypothetical protein
LRREIGDKPANIAQLSQIIGQLLQRDAGLEAALSPSWIPVRKIDPEVAEDWLVVGQTMIKKNVLENGEPDEIIAISIPVQRYSDAPLVFLERQLAVRVLRSRPTDDERAQFYKKLGYQKMWLE